MTMKIDRKSRNDGSERRDKREERKVRKSGESVRACLCVELPAHHLLVAGEYPGHGIPYKTHATITCSWQDLS
jgi:hypothetical protein